MLILKAPKWRRTRVTKGGAQEFNWKAMRPSPTVRCGRHRNTKFLASGRADNHSYVTRTCQVNLERSREVVDGTVNLWEGVFCLYYSAGFGLLYAHPPSAMENYVTALLLNNNRQNCIQWKTKLVKSHDLITSADSYKSARSYLHFPTPKRAPQTHTYK